MKKGMMIKKVDDIRTDGIIFQAFRISKANAARFGCTERDTSIGTNDGPEIQMDEDGKTFMVVEDANETAIWDQISDAFSRIK